MKTVESDMKELTLRVVGREMRGFPRENNVSMRIFPDGGA
jgi:hypothetical protein